MKIALLKDDSYLTHVWNIQQAKCLLKFNGSLYEASVFVLIRLFSKVKGFQKLWKVIKYYIYTVCVCVCIFKYVIFYLVFVVVYSNTQNYRTDYHQTRGGMQYGSGRKPLHFGGGLNKWADPRIKFPFLCSVSYRNNYCFSLAMSFSGLEWPKDCHYPIVLG